MFVILGKQMRLDSNSRWRQVQETQLIESVWFNYFRLVSNLKAHKPIITDKDSHDDTSSFKPIKKLSPRSFTTHPLYSWTSIKAREDQSTCTWDDSPTSINIMRYCLENFRVDLFFFVFHKLFQNREWVRFTLAWLKN